MIPSLLTSTDEDDKGNDVDATDIEVEDEDEVNEDVDEVDDEEDNEVMEVKDVSEAIELMAGLLETKLEIDVDLTVVEVEDETSMARLLFPSTTA